MINLDLGGNGDMHLVTDDVVNEAIQALENPAQQVDLNRFCFSSSYENKFFSFQLGSCFKMS